jgi:hypothetical protein
MTDSLVIARTFPVPVCPYAKMVPLYPFKTDSTIGLAVLLYTSIWRQFQSNTESNVNVFGGSALFADALLLPFCEDVGCRGSVMDTVASSVFMLTIHVCPAAFSFSENGLHRTMTLTASFSAYKEECILSLIRSFIQIKLDCILDDMDLPFWYLFRKN